MASLLIDKILDKWERMSLTEMAFERKEVKAQFNAKSPQIIENWCLIRYSKLSGRSKELVNHWKSELRGLLLDLILTKLTQNNSRQVRKKLFKGEWDKWEYTSDPEIIRGRVYFKFKKEGFIIDSLEGKQTCLEFVLESDNLLDTLAGGNINRVESYVNSL